MPKKIYTLLSIFFVLLSIYSISFSTISIADVLLVIMFPILTIDMLLKNKIKIVPSILLVTLFIIIHLMIIILVNQSINVDVLLRTLRFLSYLLFIGLFSKEYFDIQYGWKVLKFISIIASIYLILQYLLMNYFNYYLPGIIPGMPVIREGLQVLSDHFQLGYIRRPGSFFEEPAHYSSFVLVYFGISLFKNYKHEKWWLLLVALGIFLSGSTAGILTLLGLVIWWSTKVFGKLILKRNIIELIGLVLILLLIIGVVINLDSYETFINRTFVNRNAVNGRFGNYGSVMFLDGTTQLQYLIGRGMLNFPDYLPALPRIYYYFGIAGVFTLALIGLPLLFRKKNYSKVILVILIVSVFGTEIILGKFLILYLPFIINQCANFTIDETSDLNESINYA